ncbi:MAG TPA: glycine-rich protein [Solirubrobacterales bacterium]|nr:glycine-rich protein [Solirubrobacterales bacterium]
MRLVRGLVVLLFVCAAAKLAAPDAHAAEAPVTVAFTEAGSHPFTVPAGITSIHVVAVGAPGGDEEGFQGGRGATATADVAVVPTQVLNVFVGGVGETFVGLFSDEHINAGGFNGGGTSTGAGSSTGGGGGGASDVRTGDAEEPATRLVVAGGGGGAGSAGDGGDAGQTANSVAGVCGGGGAGTTTMGGTGGAAPGGHEGAIAGKPGTLAIGGNASGGGGGGGLFGGGGGGLTKDEGIGGQGCGGGGGSSGFGAGATATAVAIADSKVPSVTITYTPVSSTGTPPTSTPPTNPGGGNGVGTIGKVALSLPATQHGKAVIGTVTIPSSRSTLNAKLRWNNPAKKKSLLVGKLTEAPLKKGLHSFTVKLNGKGKKALEQRGKLKLTLEVRVTPPQGAAAVGTRHLTLKP